MNIVYIALSVLPVGLITALAYWRGEMVLFVLSGIALISYGLYFTDISMLIGLLIAILGGYSLFKAIVVKVR